MGEEEERQRTFDPQADPFEDIDEQEVVDVLGVSFVFQHMLVKDLKRLEKQARNPRTDNTDGARLSRSFYTNVVLGRADQDGQLIPGSKPVYDDLIDKVANAFDAAITSFLGYGGG